MKTALNRVHTVRKNQEKNCVNGQLGKVRKFDLNLKKVRKKSGIFIVHADEFFDNNRKLCTLHSL